MVVLEVLSFKFYAEHSLTSYDSKLFSLISSYSKQSLVRLDLAKPRLNNCKKKFNF